MHAFVHILVRSLVVWRGDILGPELLMTPSPSKQVTTEYKRVKYTPIKNGNGFYP